MSVKAICVHLTHITPHIQIPEITIQIRETIIQILKTINLQIVIKATLIIVTVKNLLQKILRVTQIHKAAVKALMNMKKN